MPGTIQVSVLDLLDFPFSSSSSSISIKVSMGKRDYQTQDKGDFSFPLMTLRDNLIITIVDAKGNELSRTGVESRIIVEKEFWDDHFPLEGGGYLHMKLQFILSEEDRKRIQNMRESALKKKHKELQSSSVRGSETTAAAGGGDVSSALSLNLEVSDGSEGTSSVSPLSQSVKIPLIETNPEDLVQKIDIRPPSLDVPVRSISSQEDQLGCSESFVAEDNNSVSAPLKEDQTHGPSNVRKMISAFESSISQAPDMNSQSRKTGVDPLKGPFLTEAKTEKSKPVQQILVSGANSLFTGRLLESQQAPTHISSHITRKVELDAIQTWDKITNSNEKDKQVNRTSPTRPSTAERATDSQRTLDGKVETDPPCSLWTNQRDSSGSSDLEEECGWENGRNHSQEINIRGASHEKQKSILYSECEDYPFGGSGSFIFPGEARHLCITTGGKQVMDLLRGCDTYAEIHHSKVSLSTPEAMKEHNTHDDADIEMNEDEKTSTDPRKSVLESPVDAKISIGLTGQAIRRVAIMVAFGALIFITRQTKTR